MTSSTKPDARQEALQARRYLAALPPDARRSLRKVREAARAAAPGTRDGFSYGIPGLRMDGKMVVWYAAFKSHMSLYPMTAAIRRAHAGELERYEMSKGTVRFPLGEAPPIGLIKRLVKARLADVKRELKARR